MKTIIRIMIVTILWLVLSQLISSDDKDLSGLVSTLYVVSAIFFSVGLSLVVTYNMHGVKNTYYIDQLRNNLKKVRNSFTSYFVVCSIIYILNSLIESGIVLIYGVKLDIPILSCVTSGFTIILLIINSFNLRKLNDDLYDMINRESKNE